jgi:hypothetical protein
MYREKATITTPSDDTRLWRYLSLSQFVQLLFSKSLYFCLVSELEDKWEGTLSASMRQWLRHQFTLNNLAPSASRATESANRTAVSTPIPPAYAVRRGILHNT